MLNCQVLQSKYLSSPLKKKCIFVPEIFLGRFFFVSISLAEREKVLGLNFFPLI